jgi:hypothetical protein
MQKARIRTCLGAHFVGSNNAHRQPLMGDPDIPPTIPSAASSMLIPIPLAV